MDPLHHKIFPDLLLLSHCLFQIFSQHHITNPSAYLLSFICRTKFPNCIKQVGLCFFRLKPGKMHIKLNGKKNSKYLTFLHFFLRAGLICQCCSICEILKTKISKANMLPQFMWATKCFLFRRTIFKNIILRIARADEKCNRLKKNA